MIECYRIWIQVIDKLIIFDWDGTLCDSIPRIVQCLQLAAGERGLPAPGDVEGREIVGLGLPQALKKLFPALDAPALAELERRYRQIFIALDREPSLLFPAVMDTLDNLKCRGHQLAVATGKSRRGLERALSGHGLVDFFDASRCADESSSKPDPAMLYELMLMCRRGPESSIMVGDTEFDMEMARRACIARMGVAYGAHDSERFRSYDIVACLDQFSDIIKYF